MRLTANLMLKAFVSAALLTSLGAYAATTVAVTQATTAPKQDFVTNIAMADLAKQGITNPTTAELNAAVNSVQAKRTSGMGWGEIANSLGLKLGPIVSAANRARHADDPKRTDIADSRKSNSRSAEKRSGDPAERSETLGGKGNSNSHAGEGGNSGNGNGGGNGGGGGKK